MTDTEKRKIIIEDILVPSLNKLYEMDQSNICKGVSERNICARLAYHFENTMRDSDEMHGHKLFNNYYADVEYNRLNDGNQKHYEDNENRPQYMVCDLLVHSRRELQNYLAVEMKRKGNYKNVKNDKERLKSMVSFPAHLIDGCVYGTLIGAFITYSTDEFIVELFEARDGQGEKIKEIILDFSSGNEQTNINVSNIISN